MQFDNESNAYGGDALRTVKRDYGVKLLWSLLMPILSMFYGIIVRMYLIDNQHRNLPHIHAKYAELDASINIEDSEILTGELPRKQLRLF